MKRVLLTLLAVIVILGLFAAVGFTGYRFGYAQGARATANSDDVRPQIGPFGNFPPDRMPMREFGFNRGFHREFGMRGFPGMGSGFFSLWTFLGRIAVLALIVWFIYWLFTRSGYRLTRTVQTSAPEPQPAEPEAKE
jgi:predicted PurR-regulated permease PerM